MGYRCRRCGTKFGARNGGGFWFDLLHCEVCGRDRNVAHEDLGDVHLGYVKGLGIPYAMTRAAFDRHIQATFPGPSLDTEAYHTAAEATLEPCECGGHFRYDAPARCPVCRSTSELWERDRRVSMVLYD
jgi:hypothetical protein